MSSSERAVAELRTRFGDRYTIERQLGRGGMGAVYLARDLQLDRPVALKVLPTEFAAQTDLRARFLQETRTAASFSHPNIVPVFGIEDREGIMAFAMGYVEGESVADLVKRAGPFSVRDTVRLLQDVGYALAYAHGRGIVHRDIKPDNIMIERATGRALVMDFGIARHIQNTAATPGVTRVGEVVGTPEFMSPEQASGDVVDGRSDLYALGLVAWFALTGELAISGESTQKVLAKQLTETVPPIAGRRPDLPSALSDIIDRCVRKDPADRFDSAEALVDAVDGTALRGAEVPLPIRLFADEVRQASLIFLGSLVFGPLYYWYLATTIRFDLDVIMPVVLFAAVIWGRVAQMFHQARRLGLRGFRAQEVHDGFATIVAERGAERAQLRADAAVVARRRRQLIGFALLLGVSYALQYWVQVSMRTEYRPGLFSVSRPGVWILYGSTVMKGLAVVALLRSPLRRPPGEWLFVLFWMGPIGRRLLAQAMGDTARDDRGRIDTAGVITRARAAARVESAGSVSASAGTASTSPVPRPGQSSPLEDRVAALEQWRREIDRER